MNAPTMVSPDGSTPSVSAGRLRSRTRTLRNDGASELSISSRCRSSSSGPDADDAGIKDEIRIALPGEEVDEGGLGGEGRGIDVELLEPGPTDLLLRDLDGPPGAAVVELDQQDLARPILIEGDRLRGARVGIRDRAGLRLLGRVPVTERQVVETARADLLGRDHHVVAIGLARDRDRAVDEADPPRGRARVAGDAEVAQRAVRRSLGREHRAVDDDIARRQVDARRLGVEDRHPVVGGRAAGQRLEVVRAIDRRAVVAVVRARDDDRADLRRGQALELGRHALDRAPGLDVAVEEVTRHEEEVDLLAQGEIDRGREGAELALPLSACLFPEIVVARPEMDVRGVDDP